MYIAQTLKDRIKKQCKNKETTVKTMLTECGLSINAISQINDSGGMYSFNLAKIADYLDCSVDYLLGRTDNPISHKQTIIMGGKTIAFAARLREAMHIRSAQLKKTNSEQDYGSMYWAERCGNKITELHIAAFIDARISPTTDDITVLAEALNVSVEQLTGEEEITAKNIRPYMLKPLGTVENGKRFVNTAANSDEGIYDENIDTDNEEFMAMANEPRGEDVN